MTHSIFRNHLTRSSLLACAAFIVHVSAAAAGDLGGSARSQASDPQSQARELLAPTIAARAAFTGVAGGGQAEALEPQEQARQLLEAHRVAGRGAASRRSRSGLDAADSPSRHEDAQVLARRLILGARAG
ncbi:MAG TPA: hypothetical protein VME42_07190 [Steroidobacteraceae bacterium]|nr:hypothetical protein [Steroidobacteraceae bacterium]